MIANIQNENFGWAVACDSYWSAVGNPCFFRYSSLTSSLKRTGSVSIYRYNINTDFHDLRTVLYRPLTISESIILTTESSSVPPFLHLHTELTGTLPLTADKDLLVDAGAYYSASGDGYGFSVDMSNTLLAVGNPYFESVFTFPSTSFHFSSSGYVDLFDLSALDNDPYAQGQNPQITGTGSIGLFVTVQASIPALQHYKFALLQSKDLSDSTADWVGVNLIRVPDTGGAITFNTTYTAVTYALFAFRVIGIVSTDPWITSFDNPDTAVTESFGYSVSLNDEWLAVGSPLGSGSKGNVFMFRKLNGNSESWSYWQSLPVPSDIVSGDNFGKSIGLNKCTGSWSASMVVGSAKQSQSRAYIYEFVSSSWVNTFTLTPDNVTIYPLTFYPTLPIMGGTYPNTADGFGWSVAMYKDTVVVGAPFDRDIYEYTGSSLYQQGAAYFFRRCVDPTHGFYLIRKSYGNEKTTKNNLLGWDVSVFDKYATVGCPKLTAQSMSICYLRGSLFQEHYCDDPVENTLDGQFVLYDLTTASLSSSNTFIENDDWEITNVYQVKKRLLQPYRQYGWDTCVSSQFITIGAPMLISGSYRIMDLTATTGSFTGSVNDIGTLTGKAYIYNLKNLRDKFYVGNVFYRNGKIVIMTSGSAFEGVSVPLQSDTFEYDIDFQSKQVIFEKQVVCPVEVGEFNVSTNPTAITLPMAEFDINRNGEFDFQDADILLRYMKFKSTEASGHTQTDWSSSLINTLTDEEQSVYNMYSGSWDPSLTSNLFTQSYTRINTTLFSELDFNEDNKIDTNDMNIMWKYFINRLTQKNYETYVTPSSRKKFLSDILDFLNSKTLRGQAGSINTSFLDYTSNTKSDPTGSYLAPYVTSIGLYDGCELVAIAKLGSPIKITPDFPINFVVKMDF